MDEDKANPQKGKYEMVSCQEEQQESGATKAAKRPHGNKIDVVSNAHHSGRESGSEDGETPRSLTTETMNSYRLNSPSFVGREFSKSVTKIPPQRVERHESLSYDPTAHSFLKDKQPTIAKHKMRAVAAKWCLRLGLLTLMIVLLVNEMAYLNDKENNRIVDTRYAEFDSILAPYYVFSYRAIMNCSISVVIGNTTTFSDIMPVVRVEDATDFVYDERYYISTTSYHSKRLITFHNMQH